MTNSCSPPKDAPGFPQDPLQVGYRHNICRRWPMRCLGPTGHTWLQSSVPRSQIPIKDSFHLQKPYPNKQDLSKPFFFCFLRGTLLLFCCLDASHRNAMKIQCGQKNISAHEQAGVEQSTQILKSSCCDTTALLNHLFFPSAVHINWNTCFKDSARKREKSSLIYKNTERNML